MREKIVRPFGLWESPLTPKAMAAGKRLTDVGWDDDGETLVWLEGRSDRGVLVAARVGEAPRDLTVELNVRAKVGYGGGDFTVGCGHVIFAAADSGRLYRQRLAGGPARPVTPAFGAAASPKLSPDGKWVLYVHHDDARVDRLAVVDVEGSAWPQVLVQGHDFYTQPRWSPDGRRVAFVAWNHPDMPWDGATLYLATLDGGGGSLPRVVAVEAVAGGRAIAVFQPEFSGDGRALTYVSDESGFWQLYALTLEAHGIAAPRQVTSTRDAEYGLPNWIQEMRTYGLAPDGRTAWAAVNANGAMRLCRVDLASGEERAVEALTDYADFAQLAVAPRTGRVAVIASGPRVPARIVTLAVAAAAVEPRVMARSAAETIAAAALAASEPVAWPTAGGETAHGLYLAPASECCRAAGKPPLVVLVHGGPTSQARSGWSAQAQFFATRGYAVLFVNHRGSTGYGRAYMLKLRGKWGQLDVEDAVSGARHLADRGLADPERTVVMGGSAGGYTVLQSMVDQPEAFAAGIALYGIANQFTLAQDTHKFEERYSDSLLGPLPDAAALYRERSPLFKAERIKRPLAIFQGEQDRVVPKDQSDQIVKALQRSGTPHVYHVYPGEGHGWRKTETIEHFYSAVDTFLRQHVIYR